jgi:hypothetical protein
MRKLRSHPIPLLPPSLLPISASKRRTSQPRQRPWASPPSRIVPVCVSAALAASFRLALACHRLTSPHGCNASSCRDFPTPKFLRLLGRHIIEILHGACWLSITVVGSTYVLLTPGAIPRSVFRQRRVGQAGGAARQR